MYIPGMSPCSDDASQVAADLRTRVIYPVHAYDDTASEDNEGRKTGSLGGSLRTLTLCSTRRSHGNQNNLRVPYWCGLPLRGYTTHYSVSYCTLGTESASAVCFVFLGG